MNEATGTVDCLRRAWESHESELLRYLAHELGARDLAQDVLQDVFLKSMMQGTRFCSVENPRAWLFAVARRAMIDHLRGARAFEPVADDLPAIESDERRPVDELDGCLRRNLVELPPDDRDVIEQCDLAGTTVRAYADASGLTLAAAKSRLLRARRRLRAALILNCRVRFDDRGQVCCHVDREAG